MSKTAAAAPMSHVCDYTSGECPACERESAIVIERMIRAMRGRWMVVHEDGSAYRLQSKRSARAHAAQARTAGIGARVLRWRRDRVRYLDFGFQVTSDRWLP